MKQTWSSRNLWLKTLFRITVQGQSSGMGCGVQHVHKKPESKNKIRSLRDFFFLLCLRVLLIFMRTSRPLCGCLDWFNLIPSKENSVKLVSTSVANLVQVWCRSNMWPGYVIITRSQIWNFSVDKNVFNMKKRGGGRESWHTLSCEIVLNHKCILNAAMPTLSMWYAYFSLLSGFTFHILSPFGILGTGDLKWLRAETNPSGIQLAPRASELRLLYGCVITEKRRGEKLGGVEKEGTKKRRGKKERIRKRKSRQSWFSVTPPQASSAIFNTQAYVLSNLSRPGF